MDDPVEPNPEAPRVLTTRDRIALARALKAHGLWPLRLPELGNTPSQLQRRKAARTRPALQPSIDLARRYQRADQATKLDAALQDVAHAVISNLVRLRAAVDPRVTGR
jgi:hypothetical protein